MRNVRFIKFGAENYSLFRERIDVDVKRGINFIVGPNGSGKTSTLEIPLVTLYGETSDGKKINDVINNKVGKNCFLYTDFEIIDENGYKTKYRCERYGNYKSVGNSVVLREKGKKPYKKGHREVVNEITRLISSKSLLLNTVVFPQKPKGLFLDLQDSDRKEILRKIQNLDKYAHYRQIAANKEKETEKSIDENSHKYNTQLELLEDLRNTYNDLKTKQDNFDKEKQQEIERLNNEIKQMENEISEIEKEYNGHQSENYEEKYKSITQEISNIKSKLSSIQSEETQEKENIKNRAENKKSEFDSQYNKQLYDLKEKYNNEIYRLKEEKRQEVERLDKEREGFQNKIDYRVLTEIENIKENISIEQEWVESYKNSLDKGHNICPECSQEVSPDHLKEKIENKNKEINSLNKKIEKLNEEKKECEGEIERIKNKINEIKPQYDNEIKKNENELNNKIKELDDKLRNAKNKIRNSLKSKIDEIENKFKDKKKNLEKELQEKQNELSDIEKKIKNRNNIKERLDSKKSNLEIKKGNLESKKNEKFDDSQLNDVTRRIDEIKKKTDDIQLEINNLNDRLEKIKFWKEGFSNSGIPSMLMDDAIPFINKRVKHYLDLLSDNRYIISFDTQKETKKGEMRDKISVNVFDNETGANVKNQLSGGQNRLLDIATVLTLGDLQQEIQGTHFNMMIFDEIFDSLDDENISYVAHALRKIADEKCLFVISHRHFDQIESDQTLEFIS